MIDAADLPAAMQSMDSRIATLLGSMRRLKRQFEAFGEDTEAAVQRLRTDEAVRDLPVGLLAKRIELLAAVEKVERLMNRLDEWI